MKNFVKTAITIILLGSLCWVVYLLITGEVIVARASDLEKVSKAFMERAYFDGQKEAIEGDIRVSKKCSTWMWAKSPWNEDTSKGCQQFDSIYYHPEISSIIIDGKIQKLPK
jgi:hypothetical protein